MNGRPRIATDTTAPAAVRRTVRAAPSTRGGVRNPGARSPTPDAARASTRAAVANSVSGDTRGGIDRSAGDIRTMQHEGCSVPRG